jgi:ABC-type transport system substrate-binding protein
MLLIMIFTFTIIHNANNKVFGDEPIANLVFKTDGGGVRPSYGSYIKSNLTDLNINVTIVIEEWSVFVGTLLITFDFDLAFTSISYKNPDPDLSLIYSEFASINSFGIDTSIPYGSENEDMLEQGVTIADLSSRQTHYYQWQQLLMEYILPMLPFFSPREYIATWANLFGYDARWGISNCFPYMGFSGLHDGQTSADEFNDRNNMWSELNPLQQSSNDESSIQITSLIMDPLLVISADYVPLKTGIINDWEMIDSNHMKFYMRDNIYWNPSYNTTTRNQSSGLLSSTGILMYGLKGENSTGSNQQVTAKDAVFTLIALGNAAVSDKSNNYDWISDILVDPVDDLAFHVFIDGNPDTPELEYYAPFWTSMDECILPEFFLNSTDTTIQITEGGVEHIGLYSGILNTDQWETYSESAFGCGKFMLNYTIKNSVTELCKSPYWMGIGAIDGSTVSMDISNYIIRVISDAYSSLSEFKAGKLDILDITFDSDERKLMQVDARFDVQTKIGTTQSYLAFNLRRPFIGGANNYVFLTEPGKEQYTKACAIRKAICYAIDRTKINEDLHDGEYLISQSPIPPFISYYYYNDIIKYSRNLVLAQEWLDAALGIEVPEFHDTLPILFLAISSVFIIIKRRNKK